MKKLVIWLTLIAYVTTQSTALAGPFEEGIAAGQAANPAIRSALTAPNATQVVPGYTSTPPQTTYYGQRNLASQAAAQLAQCAATPNDPVCQAQTGARNSANTPRPPMSPYDVAVVGAHDIEKNPSATLGSLASFYTGCGTQTVTTPPTTQAKQCRRYLGVGNFSCSKTLSVAVSRSTNCNPGDWFAHAGVDNYGLDAQCRPDEAESAQHFRVTESGAVLSYFDIDMASPRVFPEMVKVLGTRYAPIVGTPMHTGLWIVDNTCPGDTCSFTAMIANDVLVRCSAGYDGFSCDSQVPFFKRYGACPAGSQSGEHIQYTVFGGPAVVSTTVLDSTLCYVPTTLPTASPGKDVTGTLSGSYWVVQSNRPVVGWYPNPAYGPIPTMSMTYTRPLAYATATDQWDDQCPALAAGGRCTLTTAATCVGGSQTRSIDGYPVTRNCWEYTRTFTCASTAPLDECAPLAAQGCTPKSSLCTRTNAATGMCEVFEDTYACPLASQTTTTVGNCPSNVFCLGTNCFNTATTPDADFARSMSMLEAAREAGVYLDTDRMQVFRGESDSCRERLFKNCCSSDPAGAGMSNQSISGVGSRLVYDVLMNSDNREFVYEGMRALLASGGFNGSFTSYGVTVAVNGTALPADSVVLASSDDLVVAFDPWSLAIAVVIYVVMSMSSCNAGEGRLAMQEGAGLCHTTGTYCSSCIRLFGNCISCIEHTTGKCCFNSKLARIVNEQGRAQLGRGWGDGENPDCSGFTIAQLQSLNFAAMDLSEFYASIVPSLPNAGSIQNGNTNKAVNCYYGQGKC